VKPSMMLPLTYLHSAVAASKIFLIADVTSSCTLL
jgi:hypothetical protein